MSEFGMSAPVEKRYKQFLEDNHGEIDPARLAETMFRFGCRHAVETMVSMGDIMPMLGRIESRIVSLRSLVESVTESD